MKEDLMAWGEEAARAGGTSCCCGPSPSAGDVEYAGYRICSFVTGFAETPAGPVPVVKTRLNGEDHLGTFRVRFNVGRNNYRVAPGLYAVGNPSDTSSVLVTANYKLSFDSLRKELTGIDAWILVADTGGTNVWCSAGKKRFSARETSRMIEKTGLASVVSHRNIVLPQLAAVGVNARDIRRQTGFTVIWGPVRAKDLPRFLKNGLTAEPAMRRVSFTFRERLVLTPVELSFVMKYLFAVFPLLMILSGIGPDIFSFSSALRRGGAACAAILGAVLAGAVIVPALLNLLPGRRFAVKGGIAGALSGFLMIGIFHAFLGMGEYVSLLFWSSAVGSYLAMNFTGSTPFTSPSGVEKEMRTAIPVQAATALIALVIWTASPFVR